MHYKMIQAVQENGPSYWLIFKGVKVFGATPIARCETQDEAQQLLDVLNGTMETVVL